MAIMTIIADNGLAGIMTRQKIVSNADLTRFISAIRVAYNVPVGSTDIQALETWADFVFQQARDTTKGIEQAAASANVNPIAIT